MAKQYKITTALYEAALRQIEDRLRREGTPLSAGAITLYGDQIEAATVSTAKNEFSAGWKVANEMQESQETHNARPLLTLDRQTPKSSSMLKPEQRADMERRRAERAAEFERSQLATREQYNKHHRDGLVTLFSRHGIEKATAEKIVDECIINRV